MTGNKVYPFNCLYFVYFKKKFGEFLFIWIIFGKTIVFWVIRIYILTQKNDFFNSFFGQFFYFPQNIPGRSTNLGATYIWHCAITAKIITTGHNRNKSTVFFFQFGKDMKVIFIQ